MVGALLFFLKVGMCIFKRKARPKQTGDGLVILSPSE